MIQQIGFKNFRRYESFPLMNLWEINILVGRNNAGKSTVMKALQLLKSNLDALSTSKIISANTVGSRPLFIFDMDEFNELHIDNFERALYNHAKRKEITLSAKINDCSISVVLDGSGVMQNSSVVSVPYNSIEINNDIIYLKFDYNTRELNINIKKESGISLESMLKSMEDLKKRQTALKEELGKLNKNISNFKNDKDLAIDLVGIFSKRQELENSLKNVQGHIKILEDEIAKKNESQSLALKINNIPKVAPADKENIISQLFNDIYGYIYMPIDAMDKRTSEYAIVKHNQEELKSVIDDIRFGEKSIISVLSSCELEYIHAHAASQKVIYLKEDRSDILSRTLTKFCKAKIQPGDPEWTFIKKWMNADFFGIGDDFRIDDIQGAGYMLKILEGDYEMNLADKGTGSIQMMTLLLCMAVIINKVRTQIYCPTVLIEEPEQNIHPMLQSKLADLFHDFWAEISCDNDNCNLIIETHSEYMIRRTQVLVAEQCNNDEEMLDAVPFKVYYFPVGKNELPYDMEYEKNGRFRKSFGSGFFDEAGSQSLKLSENEMTEVSNQDFNWDVFEY